MDDYFEPHHHIIEIFSPTNSMGKIAACKARELFHKRPLAELCSITAPLLISHGLAAEDAVMINVLVHQRLVELGVESAKSAHLRIVAASALNSADDSEMPPASCTGSEEDVSACRGGEKKEEASELEQGQEPEPEPEHVLEPEQNDEDEQAGEDWEEHGEQANCGEEGQSAWDSDDGSGDPEAHTSSGTAFGHGARPASGRRAASSSSALPLQSESDEGFVDWELLNGRSSDFQVPEQELLFEWEQLATYFPDRCAGAVGMVTSNLNRLGWAKPLPLQSRVVPALVSQPGRPYLVQAYSGSGKSAAYVVACAAVAAANLDAGLPQRGPRCEPIALVLVPSDELAEQVARWGNELVHGLPCPFWNLSAEKLSRFTRAHTAPSVGVVVLTEVILREALDMSIFSRRSLRLIVLDEADCLLSNAKHCVRSLLLRASSRGLRRNGASVVTAFVSATTEMSSLGKPPPTLLGVFKEFTLQLPPGLRLCFKQVQEPEKFFTLLALLCKSPTDQLLVPTGHCPPTTHAVFTKDRTSARSVVNDLNSDAYRRVVGAGGAAALNGLWAGPGCSQRQLTAREFAQGHIRVLVTTGEARGLDFPDLRMVVNYDLPKSIRHFVHRVGRVSRAGRPGVALSFVSSVDQDFLPALIALLVKNDRVVPEWLNVEDADFDAVRMR
eukprot:RCo017245